MALAVNPPEVRISQILQTADRPITADEIYNILVGRYKMKTLKKSIVNGVLYNTPIFKSVPATRPPQWYLEGSRASRGLDVHMLTGLPVLDDADPVDIVDKRVLLAGQCDNVSHISMTLGMIASKGATAIVCLGCHQSGATIERASENIGIHAVLVGDDVITRKTVVAAHRDAFTQSDILVLVDSPTSQDPVVHHLVSGFEIQGRPIYISPPPEDSKSAKSCKNCT